MSRKAFAKPIFDWKRSTPPQTDPSDVDTSNRYRREQSRFAGRSAKSFRRWATKDQLEKYRRLKKGRLRRFWGGRGCRHILIRDLVSDFMSLVSQASVPVMNISIVGASTVKLITYFVASAARVWALATNFWFLAGLAIMYQVGQAVLISLLEMYGDEALFYWMTKNLPRRRDQTDATDHGIIYVNSEGAATFVPPFGRPFVDQLRPRLELVRMVIILRVFTLYFSWRDSEMRETTREILSIHWAPAIICAISNPVSFAVTFMSLSILIDMSTSLRGSGLKGRRQIRWPPRLVLMLMLLVGVEGAGVAQGVSTGNAIGAAAAVASVAVIGLKKRPARVSASPVEGQRGAKEPSKRDILRAVDDIYQGVEDKGL
ncbi:hypothetical protein THAOC_19274, partial [Thalassiosira oceanica]